MWPKPKGTPPLIFIYSLSPLISSCHHWVEIFRSDSRLLYLLSFSYFSTNSFSSHSSSVCGRSTYQFLSPVGFNRFLCAISSQSCPSSDKYSFQPSFTGSEPISGFSPWCLLTGNLACQGTVAVCEYVSLWWSKAVFAPVIITQKFSLLVTVMGHNWRSESDWKSCVCFSASYDTRRYEWANESRHVFLQPGLYLPNGFDTVLLDNLTAEIWGQGDDIRCKTSTARAAQ